MASKDPEERAMIAQIAARSRWAKVADRKAATAKARGGLRARFERDVRAEDPDGLLTPADVEYRVDQLMRAHMLRMSLAAKRRARAVRESREGPIPDTADTAPEAELDRRA